MIGGSIAAVRYRVNPALIAQTVGVGMLLPFPTLPAWWRGLSLI